MIQASVVLTHPSGTGRQFVVTTGSGHHLIVDDAVGVTGPKPIEADQAGDPPQVFTKVRIRHIVTGADVDREALESAIHLSETKYCSVGAMVQESAGFKTTYEIIPTRVAELVEAGVHGR
jgi:uncharacterized OsmC-like protein